jgi:hypothetical protein
LETILLVVSSAAWILVLTITRKGDADHLAARFAPFQDDGRPFLQGIRAAHKDHTLIGNRLFDVRIWPWLKRRTKRINRKLCTGA